MNHERTITESIGLPVSFQKEWDKLAKSFGSGMYCRKSLNDLRRDAGLEPLSFNHEALDWWLNTRYSDIVKHISEI